MNDLITRLRKRAEIRRQISTRKSVQNNEPDRISDLLEEAANTIESLSTENLNLNTRFDWLISDGHRYTEAIPYSASMYHGRGPYITLKPPSLNGMSEILLDKQTLFNMVDRIVQDKKDKEYQDTIICKKCNSDLIKSPCEYPHSCPFSGIAYCK